MLPSRSGTLQWDEILRYQRTRVARSLEVRDRSCLSVWFSIAQIHHKRSVVANAILIMRRACEMIHWNEVSTVILMKADKLVRVSGMSLHEAQRIVANFPVSRLTVRCLFRYTKKRSCSLRLEHNFSLRSLVHTLLMSIWWRAKKVRNASITEATSCSKHL